MRSIFICFISLAMTLMSNGLVLAQDSLAAVVAADKLNVLFVGINNPVSIAVPGIASDKIGVKISRGTITGKNGKYVVFVDTVGEVAIEITAEESPGITRKVGDAGFRVGRQAQIRHCIG